MLNRYIHKDIFKLDNIYEQYLICRRNKRNTISALKFEQNCEYEVINLYNDLQQRHYMPSRSIAFIVDKPKIREIIAADFRDRVVHHILVNFLESIYEPIFIYDSYACRINKGVHKAIKRVRYFLRQLSSQSESTIYSLKMDIKNFFMHIDKQTLYDLIYKKLNHYWQKAKMQGVNNDCLYSNINNALWLLRILIKHMPQGDYVFRGSEQAFQGLPAHKSLLKARDNQCGLPIGNLTSQFFANVYLNELDQYVKHQLKCKYYARYCDDFVLLSHSQLKLAEHRFDIEQFLESKLKLHVNKAYGKIETLKNGIGFVGVIIRRDYTLVRRRVVANFKAKLKDFKQHLVRHMNVSQGNATDHREIERQIGIKQEQLNSSIDVCLYDFDLLEKLRATVASFLGHVKHYDSYHLRQKIFKEYAYLRYFFCYKTLESSHFVKLEPLYRHPKSFMNFYQQYEYFQHQYLNDICLFQMGKYYEIYQDLEQIGQDLRLIKLAKNTRKASYGFAQKYLYDKVLSLVNAGFNVTVIKEEGVYFGNVMMRLPKERFIINN